MCYIKQLPRVYSQSLSQRDKRYDCEVVVAIFDPLHLRFGQSRLEGKVRLRQATLYAQALQVLPKSLQKCCLVDAVHLAKTTKYFNVDSMHAVICPAAFNSKL